MGKELVFDLNKIGFRTATDISLIADEPSRYLVIDLNEKSFCFKCGSPFTIHSTSKYTSFRCGCGTRIWYFPKFAGQKRLATWIPIEEYLRGLNARKT